MHKNTITLESIKRATSLSH